MGSSTNRSGQRFDVRHFIRPFAVAASLGVCASVVLPPPLAAQVAPDHSGSSLAAFERWSDRLHPGISVDVIDEARSGLAPSVDTAWNAFRQEHGSAWVAYIDARSGRIESAEGEGIAWIPGAGNRLGELVENRGKKTDLAALEAIARRFVDEKASLLGIDSKALVLSASRSGKVADYLWYVDFDVTRGGLPIEGARVVFRVNNGNLIQFGLENLPPGEVAVPKVTISPKQALQIVADSIGGFLPDDTIVDAGSLHLLPAAASDARFAEGFAFGKGYGLAAVWEVTFRREGELGTWRARVDASRGELLEFSDVNHYAQPKVTGGVALGDPRLFHDVVKAMPFADLSNATFAASTGKFTPTGGLLSSKLDGRYVRISDKCGAIKANTDVTGNLPFGWQTFDTTDCQTSGIGGLGNTRSSRTAYFWVNRAKEFARGWLPSIAWLWQKVTVNVNGSPLCNAYWNGSTLNFFKGDIPCRNTGEVPGVAIHEMAHGLDSNDGNGTPAELATGESNGDVLNVLMLHKSCIAEGMRSADCNGFGDGCFDCFGVRDIDFAKHESNTRHTVTNFVQPLCATSTSYRGPCGREGHCESIVPSETVWDFVNRKLPNPGGAAAWNTMERLWLVSRPTATQSFTCNTNQASWNADGCNIGSLWKVLRAADDDDGNLANGTPHGTALLQAFLDHGISCIFDPGAGVTFSACTPPPAPVVTATAGDDRVTLTWSNANSNQFTYDVYRNDVGCNAGFARIAPGFVDAITDVEAANGQRYFYQVVGRRIGNEACASAPSACVQVMPHAP